MLAAIVESLRRCHHRQDARRHHHELESGRRADLRLRRRRDHRQAHLRPDAARACRGRASGSWSVSGAASGSSHFETKRRHQGRAHHRRLAQRLADPRRRRHDRRGLESRQGHHRPQAGRGGAGAAARRRRGGPGRGRSGQPHEGRIPGHPLPRAAHAAQRHPRLGQDPPLRQGRCRGPGGGPRGHRAEFAGPGPAHRGPARHLPHHLRQAPPRSPAAQPRRGHRGRPRRRHAGGRRQGHPHPQGARFARRARSPATPPGSSRSSGTCSPTP